MHEEIKNFYKQFSYEPEIKNLGKLKSHSGLVVVGMGGSALAARLLKILKPDLDVAVHCDYGLPEFPVGEMKKKLIILNSYSGNTEEVLNAFREAQDKKLNVGVVSIGGKLLALAKENGVPYIQMPDTGIQPRMALGFSIKAFLKFLGEESELNQVTELATILDRPDYDPAGKVLAQKIKNHIPVIYASNHNFPLAYIWKIKLNETGKIPAFCNVFPELNHTEMNGFNVNDSTKSLSDKFYFLILKDPADDPKILKRMEVTEKMYRDRGLKVEVLELSGDNVWQKIFSSLILADWMSYHLALSYGSDPEQVPMVEEFKKLIAE